MWDGIFHSGKDSFALGRAVFCFAASKMVPSPAVETVLGEGNGSVEYSKYSERWRDLAVKAVKEASKEDTTKEVIEKCSDFIDRIDIMLCIPPIHPRLQLEREEVDKEYIDIACLLIKKHFPSVKRIEVAVIVVLMRKLIPTSSRRSAERSVFCSTTPKDDIFEFKNLPGSDQERYGEDNKVSVSRNIFLEFKVKD